MRRSALAALFMLHVAFAPAALADVLRDRVAEGNQLYAEGKYAEALEAYRAAGEDLPEDVRAEVLHNRAAAQFKLGNIDEARELWVRVASSRDARFEAAARYNIGNCHYGKALAAIESQDPNGATTAMRLLDDAIAQYRDAARLDPELASARANLELAAKLKKQLQEQSTSQPQSQPTSQRDQQQQNDPNRPESQPSSQPQSQPSSQPSEEGDSQEDQQQQEQQDRDPNQRSDEQDQQQQQEPQSQPASQPQEQPGEEEQTPESQPSAEPSEEPMPEIDPNKMQKIKLSPEEARRLLQMIRDAEKQRREELRRREAARYRPVDKDW